MAVTDSAVTECGPLGKYQLLQILILGLLMISGSQNFLVVNFHNFEPKHRCALPEHSNNVTSNLTWYKQNITSQNITQQNVTQNVTEKDEGVCTLNGTKCTRFTYSKDRYPGKTLVTEFNLVCDNRSISTISTTLFTCCLMIGALFGGAIADRFGRRWSTIGEIFVASSATLALVFTQNMYMYVALRGVIGFCVVGTFISINSLGLEITGPTRRTFAASLITIAWPLGCMSLSPIAYFLPDWDDLQTFLAVFAFTVSFIALFFLNESPHYLVVKGRYKEAEKILRRMAQMNGSEIDEKMFERLRTEQVAAVTEKLVTIFKAKTLLKRVGIFCYLWFVAGLAAYGLVFNVKNMSGNVIINNVLITCTGLANPVSVLTSKYLGRKPMTVSHLFLGAAALFTSAMLTIFTDINDSTISTVILVVSMIGSYAIGVVFQFNYFWCVEVFPTTMRASLGGIVSFCARVGSIFSPLLVDLYKYVDTEVKSGLGPLIFGITMLIGGILAFFLPETNNMKIPETIQEANIFLTKGHEKEFRAVRRKTSEDDIDDDGELEKKFSDGPTIVTRM